jgi:hypothetical protein
MYRSKIRRPIDVEWSRGLVAVIHDSDHQAAPFFQVFWNVLFVVTICSAPPWPHGVRDACIKGVRVTVDTPPHPTTTNINKTNEKTMQPDDQDIWSNFRFCWNKTRFLEHIKHRGFSQKPSLGTILHQSGVEFCSPYVVSSPTLTDQLQSPNMKFRFINS